MQVRLLGTGGSDGIPAFYGNDRVSAHARKVRGKEMRTRSAALVDGTLKIDLGPDTLCQLNAYGLEARDWTAAFFTHSDGDHLCLSELQYGLFPFVECEDLEFTIYANETVCGLINERYPKWPIDLVRTYKNQTYLHEGYEITPVEATHTVGEECHNLIFAKDGVSFLYGTDTGVYSEATFEVLAGRQLDALVIECSDGKYKTPYVGHMDLAQCVEVVGRLRSSGALRPGAQVVTTHHTAGGDLTHAELEEILRPYDIVPGFDGMVIEI